MADQSKARLRERLKEFPKLSKSNARLFPYRNEIRALRAKNAAYDDIRLILKQENVIVSLNTLYRFCRDVLNEKVAAPAKQRAPKLTPAPIQRTQEVESSFVPQQTIQAALQDRRERLPGVWGRRKRGPRIADSKNL